MITQEVLKEIKMAGQEADWNSAFGGRSRGNKHLQRVAKIAVFLAKKEGLCAPLIEAAAWLHDVVLSVGADDYNPEESKKVAIKFLRRFKLTDEEKMQIAECIVTHEGTKPPKSLEAEIIHDCDVLDKTGILGMIRHTWKLVHLGEIQGNVIGDQVVAKILAHINWRGKQLFTREARQLHRALQGEATVTKECAKRIIQIAARLAENGMITEKIAARLLKQLSEKQRKILKAQLNLSYLR